MTAKLDEIGRTAKAEQGTQIENAKEFTARLYLGLEAKWGKRNYACYLLERLRHCKRHADTTWYSVEVCFPAGIRNVRICLFSVNVCFYRVRQHSRASNLIYSINP